MIRSNENSTYSAPLYSGAESSNDTIIIREPSSGREADYRPWEAPPIARPSENAVVEAHQLEVEGMLTALIDQAQAEISTKELISQHILSSDVRLDIDNQNGYEKRLMLLPELELSNDKLRLHDKVMIGTANIAENFEHMDIVQRSSSELAMIRTVGSARTVFRPQMFSELADAMGDSFNLSDPRNFQIVGFDGNFYRDKLMESFIFSFKQDCGRMPDGTEVKARTSLVVRTDYGSGFDQGIRKVIHKSAQYERTHIPMLQRIKPILEEISEQNVLHNFVVGSITSVYAYNPEVEIQLAERQSQIKNKIASYSIKSGGMYFPASLGTE